MNINNFVKNNLSDSRYYVFDGECETYFATLIFGKRETPYYADGISNENVEFGIIEVMFFNKKTEETISCKLDIDNLSYNVILEKNPITFSYMTDLEKIYNQNSTIYLTVEDQVVNLENQTKNWQINFQKALHVGINTFKDFIISSKKNNLNTEFYLKIIGKANSYENKFFYWCFSIKGENISKSCAIDVETGEVLTKT